MSALRAASLFAGIGGFDLAMHALGIRPELVAEINPSAQSVLAGRFGGSKLVGDATKVDLRGFDLVAAGFPCQGLSNAASTRDHSGLFDEESSSAVVWAALERIAGVPFICLENASSLTTARYAEDLRALLQWFTEHEYDARVYVLNAGLYGVPLRRERAFVLARLRAMPWPEVEQEVRSRCSAPIIGVSGQQGGAAWCVQPSPTLKSGTYTLAVTEDDVRSVTPEGLETLLGFPVGHTLPAGSQTQRYQRLGNAVAVPAAECALRILLAGVPSPVRPVGRYPLEMTVRARGGTSGSMVNRIYRSLRSGRGNHNAIETRYCLPVYARRMTEDARTVTREQFAALAYVEEKGLLPSRVAPWPSEIDISLRQPGLLPVL